MLSLESNVLPDDFCPSYACSALVHLSFSFDHPEILDTSSRIHNYSTVMFTRLVNKSRKSAGRTSILIATRSSLVRSIHPILFIESPP